MRGEGVTFFCGVNVGVDKSVEDLLGTYDAVVYCGGSETPRTSRDPRDGPARRHDAMPYLVQQKISASRARTSSRQPGRQTQSSPAASISSSSAAAIRRPDCVGTAFRQGALRVYPARYPPAATRARGQADRLALLGDEDAHLVHQPKERKREFQLRRSNSSAKTAFSPA